MDKSVEPMLEVFFAAAAQRKAEAVLALDLRGKSDVADYIVLCSGRSSRQVMAIAQSMEDFLRSRGLKSLGVEGAAEGRWVLMDYGDVVVHVFYEATRQFYDLEGLWADAPRIRPGP